MGEDEKLRPVSNLRLYGLASAIGVAGMLLVLLQALWMIPRQQASPALVILFLCAPLAVFVILPLLPRRKTMDLGTRYEWSWPVVYIALGLPAAFTLLSLFLVALNHDFDTISGVPLFLALIVGTDLGELARCLLLMQAQKRLHEKHRH
jgi:hypothetical protein